MPAKSTLRKIGNSQGVTIPKSLCETLGVSVGAVFDMEHVKGSIILTPTQAEDVSFRIGAARGRKLAGEAFYDRQLEAEIAGEFEAAL